MSDDTRATVLQVFREVLGLEIPSPDTDLIESGLLDSLSLVTLVFEIEQRCSISIPFESLDVEAFRTVNSIAGVVEAAA